MQVICIGFDACEIDAVTRTDRRPVTVGDACQTNRPQPLGQAAWGGGGLTGYAAERYLPADGFASRLMTSAMEPALPACTRALVWLCSLGSCTSPPLEGIRPPLLVST